MPRPWPLRHALFLLALVLGVAVRTVVVIAYRPALVFYDSPGYLERASAFSMPQLRPGGYSLFLGPIVRLTQSVQGDLTLIQLVHHVIGLALAVACYAFLIRRGIPRWGATLAVLPLLFDPLQLVLEHYILSDLLFEALLVAACLLVLWRHRPTAAALVVAGLSMGSASLVRGAGSFLIVVFLIALVCLRPGWVKVTAFLVAAAIPIASYALAFHREYGSYATSTGGPRFLYARIAPVVYCRDPQLQLPSYERRLCPRLPIADRPSTNYYMWGGRRAPQYHVQPPAGMTDLQVIKDFDKRVVRAQPVAYTKAVLKDLAGGFAPTRTYDVPGYPASYWLFVDHYWAQGQHKFRMSVAPGAAAFLQSYRMWVYTPGPLMAAMLLVAAATTLGVGRARASGDRVAVGLLAGACLMTLLTGAALSGFSWRYQLPQIPLFPIAGALGLAALLRGRSPRAPEPTRPLRPLDRAAHIVTRAPMPASWRRATQSAAARGGIQLGFVVLTGALAPIVVATGAVQSGWFMPETGVIVGVAVGIGLVTMALAARVRAAKDVAREELATKDADSKGRVAEVAASPSGGGRAGDPPSPL